MDKSSDDYHISFFKPTTVQATANRNTVVWLVLIWFITIFGFQILLKVVEEPTPEPAYLTFQEVWVSVAGGSADKVQLQKFGQVTLSVLGKMSLNPADRSTLDNALSYTVYSLIDGDEQVGFLQKLKAFEKLKNEITNISDKEYIEDKVSLSAELTPLLKLSTLDVRSKILPLELTSVGIESISPANMESIPIIMEKFLVHNQSFLTDAIFLGFPFHYFYTAIFLLVLFVGLCWLYCVVTDRLNAKLNIAD